MGDSPNGWFIMEKKDLKWMDLGVPPLPHLWKPPYVCICILFVCVWVSYSHMKSHNPIQQSLKVTVKMVAGTTYIA